MKGNNGADNKERPKTTSQPIVYWKLSLPRLARREIIAIAVEVPIKIRIEWTTSARTILIVDRSNTGDGLTSISFKKTGFPGSELDYTGPI
jgi:hypothetical protein